MRWLALVFALLIVALQYPMWLGKGGWLQVREYDRQLAEQRTQNDKLKLRNDALDADVRDLKAGSEAIEERARNELGMIRQDEVFFQLQPAGSGPRAVVPKAPAGAKATGAGAKPQPATPRVKPQSGPATPTHARAGTTGEKPQPAASGENP